MVVKIKASVWTLMFTLALPSFLACADSMSTAPSPPQEDIVYEVLVTPNALTMAVGETIPITVVAKNILGDTLAIDANNPVVWESLDQEIVSVDANGVLTARAPTESFVNVTATWTRGGSTKSATLFVRVTSVRYPVRHFRIIGKDSTRVSVPLSYAAPTYLVVDAVDSAENSLFSPQVQFEFRDAHGNFLSSAYPGPSVFYLGGQYLLFVFGIQETYGKFWVIAQSTMYGVPIRDSVQFTGLYPSEVSINIDRDSINKKFVSSFVNQTAQVQPCAYVVFGNISTVPVDIIFDDPGKASGCTPADTETGNILGIGQYQNGIRKFPNIGTITWSIRNPATGSIDGTGTITMRNP